MPTATRLFSALIFAAIGYAAADLAAQTLEEGVSAGYVREIAVGLGLICGWSICGVHAPRSVSMALAYGVNSSAMVLIGTLLVISASEMLRRSMLGRYDGPMEGLEAMIELALGFARVTLLPSIMAVLILGGLVGGLIAHGISRIWR